MAGRKLARQAVIGLTAMAVAGTLTYAAEGSAAAAPADVICHTNKFTIVRSTPAISPNNHLYGLDQGSGFRLAGLSTFNDGHFWEEGNGNGHSLGWAPADDLNC